MRLPQPISTADDKGFTLIEVLIVALLITILALVGIIAFTNQRDKASDSAARAAVMTTIKAAKASYMTPSLAYPAEEQLIAELNEGVSGINYHAYDHGAHPSTDTYDISVEREASDQASFCSRSDTQMVYCARINENANLRLVNAALKRDGAQDSSGPLSSVVALLPGGSLLFPDSAEAVPFDDNNPIISRCVGTREAAARSCLATSFIAATDNDGASRGWDGTPPSAPTYEEVIEADDPSAVCGFDEEGSEVVRLDCDGISGQYQDGDPFETGAEGAIPEEDDNTAVEFTGEENDSYGIPGDQSLSNEGDNWTIEIWVKPKSAGTSNGMISSDDHWLIRFAKDDGFTCGTNTTGKLETVTGGPPASKGHWYYVVCVYDHGTMTLYVNAEQVAQRSGIPNGLAGNGPWRPGYVDGWSGGGKLHGVLDAFAFYKSSLSAADIAAHYVAAGYS